MEKKVNDSKASKQLKTSDVTRVYGALSGLNISKLERDKQFAILRTARALKATTTALNDFVKDAQERLKPDGFDEIEKKRQRFSTLSDSERMQVNAAIIAYNKSIDDCVQPEADKLVEIDFDRVGEDVIAAIASVGDNLDVETLMLIEDVIGEKS